MAEISQNDPSKEKKMKIRNIMGAIASIAIVVCSESELTESQATALAEQLAGAIADSMAGMDPNASENDGLENDGFDDDDFDAQVTKSVQCNPDTGTCTYYIPLSYTSNCTVGGRIEVSGDISGTTTDGSGYLTISATETITDWECITGFIINGDPYITLSGTFSFLNGQPATQQTMTISGGFEWGSTAAESCQISLTINYNSDGGATMSGTICGYSVSASV
jgi:hypothetical protein